MNARAHDRDVGCGPFPPRSAALDGGARGAATFVRALLAASALLAMLVGTNRARGQSEDDSKGIVEFRRIRVQAEQLTELARGYLPIREAEFNQLLADAARKSRRGGPGGAGCVRAEYFARFENDALVEGRARLDVRVSGGAPATWTWGDTNLPIRDPAWSGEPARPALLGLVATGTQAVLVESAGILTFDWAMRGERTSRDRVAFALRPPGGAYQSLRLDLPSSLVPSCRDALVRRLEPAEVAPPLAANRAAWSVEWQGERTLELQLNLASSRRAATPTARVRQDTLYSIDARGLELQVDWRIDTGAEPLQSLTLNVDRRLRIGAIRLGDKALAWNRRVGAISADLDEVVVQTPDLSGEDRTVQLSALAPLELGAAWTLPSLQPRDVLWLEGETQVTVHDPLAATRLEARGGRIVGATGATTERRRTWRVRMQDPDAQLVLSVDAAPPRLRIRAGTTVTSDAGNMSARCVADVTPLTGSVFLLEAELPRAWLLDGVETTEGPAVDDFQVGAIGTPGRQLLRVRLREPLATGRSLRLVVRARRTPPGPNAAIGVDQLRLLKFRDGAGNSPEVFQIVAVGNVANSRPRFSGDRTLDWLDPAALSDADQALIETNGGTRVFVADQAADDVEVRFERERPRFQAEIETSAVVRGDRLVESYRLRLTPDSSALDRAPVYFTRARAATLHWKFEGTDEPPPNYRRLPAAGENADPGETWEVTFARPRAAPFTLTAERSSPLESQTALSLASLPEAAEQAGQVRVAANVGAGRWINRGLRPLGDVSLAEAEGAAKRLGVIPGTVVFYEYEPTAGDASGLTYDAKLPADGRVWATSAVIRTLAAADGVVRHRCEYELENVGADEATWTFASDLRPQRVLVDGADRTPPDVDSAGEDSGTRRIRCELPLGARRSLVVLEFVDEQPMAGELPRLLAPRVTPSFPVLERTWRVSLPRERAVWDVAGADRGGAVAAVDFDAERLWPPARWNQRLFGLLLRDEGRDEPGAGGSRDEWSGPAESAGAPRLGWHAFDVRFASDVDVTLRLCRTTTWNAWAWIALLLTTVVVGWDASRRAWVAPFAAVMAGLAALSVPGLVSVVVGGAFLGALFAPLAVLGMRIRSARPPALSSAPPDSPPREGTTLTAAALPSLLLLGWIVSDVLGPSAISQVAAQEESRPLDAAPERPPRTPFRVLVPVDGQGQRSGDYVHLPREFYHLLRRLAEGDEAATRSYFITSVEYSARLQDGDAPLVDLSADYDVEVRGTGARVFWPFARGRTTLVETRVTRAGETVEAEWQAENTGWRTTFAEPGSYRVHVRLHVPAAAGATMAEVAIPPLARGVIRWRSGEGTGPLQFVREACGPDETGENGERSVRLGPTSRLRFQWNAALDSPLAAPADQLYWLHVRPGSVQLDFCMKIPPTTAPASRTLRLRHDPQLRLLPVGASESVVRAQPAPGPSGWLQVDLAESDEPLDVRLSFLLSRATGIGRLVVPRIEWPGGRVERRWLGVTVAPSLEMSRQEGGGLEPLPVPTFLQAWGPTDALPLVAYRLSPEDEPGMLAVRQRDAAWTAVETSAYSLRRVRGELTWQADVNVEVGPVFQYEVALSGAPRVLDVSLSENGESAGRPLRWTVGTDGRLRFLSEQPLGGAHRITVQADFPLPFDKETSLPTMTLVGRTPSPRSVRLARNDSLSVERAVLEDWTPANSDETAETEGNDDEVHFVGRWQWSPAPGRAEPAPPAVVVRLNRPRIRGRLLTTVVPAGETWTAIVRGSIQADRGRIERVRLEAPGDWTGPWSSDDGAAWTRRSAPGQVRTQLARVVVQEAPGPFEFTLRGPLKTARLEHPRAPDIQLLDAVASDRYLALPTVDRGRKLVWETSGLRAVVQPDGWLTSSLESSVGEESESRSPARDESLTPGERAPSSFQFYQIVAPRFQASVVDVNEGSPEARVRHAGHQLYLRSSGSGWGRSTFTILAGGRHDCLVDLPAGERLVYARTAGEYALIERGEDGGWRVPLVDTYDAQEVELTYLIPPGGGSLEARVPLVRDWPTENSSVYRASPPRRVDGDAGRWPAAALLVLAALIGAGLSRWDGWRDYLAVGPALPAVLVAIGWWLWFDPRWFGLLIGLAGLLAANLPSTIRLGTKRGLC